MINREKYADASPESRFSTIRKELHQHGDAKKAKFLSGYFKTGPGEYAEGDVFLGIAVPELRRFAARYVHEPLHILKEFLHSPFHEERLFALVVMVMQFQKSDRPQQKILYDFYLKEKRWVNNWDLVDLSAPHIVGGYLDKEKRDDLYKLVNSRSLWERRIAIISTLWFVKNKDSSDALRLAVMLLHDKHDLIHKAVGWTLREVGKYCGVKILEEFLEEYAGRMPRTMLRYALEKFPPEKRKYYMGMKQVVI